MVSPTTLFSIQHGGEGPILVGSRFFDEQEAQSRVKTEIVLHYFRAWATVIPIPRNYAAFSSG